MRTFTSLVGTTATTSPSTYGGAFTTLTNNNSSQAVAIGQQLVNDAHRYLIQKYFDNEKTVTITTIGAQSLTLTSTPAIGDKTATLTATWTYPTCSQYLTFSSGEQRMTLFTNGSAALTWADALLKVATTSVKSVGVQDYSIPANVSKIKDNTINVGQLKYHPTPIISIQEWNQINFLPYTSDIPNYFFLYNGKFSVFPIPSTTGNIITFNYKTRVIDMSYQDYSVGTLATMVVGSTTVTGTSSLWTVFPQNVDLDRMNLYLRADVSTGGDGIWYPINQFTSATSLTLKLPIISAPDVTASTTYTIGQMPYLSEDFHDMIVYQALRIYFSTISQDAGKFKQYDEIYKEKLEALKDYAGTKTTNLDLEAEPQQVNPNLFIYAN
jgi:hypothetical protein